MAEPYQIELTDKTSELNKRVDDAFMELHTHLGRMNGLTMDYTELRQELLRLQKNRSQTFCGHGY